MIETLRKNIVYFHIKVLYKIKYYLTTLFYSTVYISYYGQDS